jgi:hypothetical protein
MEKTEAKGSPAVGDGSEAKVGDAEEAKPSVEMESVVVQDSELMDSENMLTRDNQPEWIVRIAKRWALERGDVEELMHLLVGGCDDACGMNYEHAHDAMMRIFFRKKTLKGEGNAGVNVFMSLVKDIRKETQYYRSERQKLRKAYDVQEVIRKAERDKLVKEQSVKLEGAVGALEEVMVQAKSKVDLMALSNRKEREELIEQFDRVQRQNNSLSDTIAVHVDKTTKLTTTVEQQGFTTAKFKQHVVVTADGQGQQASSCYPSRDGSNA